MKFKACLVAALFASVALPAVAEEPATWRVDPRAQTTIYSGSPQRVRICVNNQAVGVRWGGHQTIIRAKSCADIEAENIELSASGAPVAVEGTYAILSK